MANPCLVFYSSTTVIPVNLHILTAMHRALYPCTHPAILALIFLCAGTRIVFSLPVTEPAVSTSNTLISTLTSSFPPSPTTAISQRVGTSPPPQITAFAFTSSAVTASTVNSNVGATTSHAVEENQPPPILTAEMTRQVAVDASSATRAFGPGCSSAVGTSTTVSFAVSTPSMSMAVAPSLSFQSSTSNETTVQFSLHPLSRPTTTFVAAAAVSSLSYPVSPRTATVSSAQIMGVVGAFLVTIFVAFFLLRMLSFMPCVRHVRSWRSQDDQTSIVAKMTSPLTAAERYFHNMNSEEQWKVQEKPVQLPSANVWPGKGSRNDQGR
jgi:hypothetical protein